MTSAMLMETTVHDDGAVYDRLSASLQGQPPEEAVRRIREFLATFPSFALAHNDLGVLYHQTGNSTLALAYHEKAARLQPENTLFKKNLADFYAVELGWLEEAVDIYLEVVKRNPRDTEALIALGQLGAALAGSRTLGASPERVQLESHAAPPESVVALQNDQELYQKAQDQIAEGHLAESAAILEELINRQPFKALYCNDLGVVRYKSGDFASSLACYEKAVQLEPGNTLYARNLADLYFAEMNRADDAIRIYLDLHRENPRDVETLTSLGHICGAVGRPAEAKTFYRRVLELEPWNKEARQALELQQEALISTPSPHPARSTEQLVGEARELMQQGQAAEARKLLEQAIELNPRSAMAHNDLGVVAYSLGDVAVAQAAYDQAIRLEPGNLNFVMNLADLYFVAADRPDDAIQMYLELFRQYPRNIEVLTALGRICQAVGRPDEARTFYRRVLEIEPWNREVREALQQST